MSDIKLNVQVQAARVLTPDEDGRYLVTPEALNDMAVPIVSVAIPKLSLFITPSIIVNDEVDNEVDVNIQFRLLANEDDYTAYQGVLRFNAWLSDSFSTGALTATTPDITGEKKWDGVLTGSTGAATLTIGHSGAHTWYLFVEISGVTYYSDPVTFA